MQLQSCKSHLHWTHSTAPLSLYVFSGQSDRLWAGVPGVGQYVPALEQEACGRSNVPRQMHSERQQGNTLRGHTTV